MSKENKKSESKPVLGYVTNTIMLNVRSSVTLTSEIVTLLNKDDEVEIDTKFKDPSWLKLKKPVKGYVLSKYIEVRE